MSNKLSIRGKQFVILCPRTCTKYVSFIYHDSRLSATRLTPAIGHVSVQWEGKKEFSRHISVVFISVRLIISATWVRQFPLSLDIETSSNIESKANIENKGTDESCLHENLFVFDRAFAQEIKYLFAELDFDLYMCRDKQGGMKKRQVVSRRIPFWRPKEQHQTFVYFIRQNDSSGIFSNGRGANVGEYIEQVCLDQVLEAFNEDMKSDVKHLPIHTEEPSQDMSVEDYLLRFEARDAAGKNLKSLHEDEPSRKDMTVEEYLKLCEEEKDITVEEYLKSLEEENLPVELTVEQYIKSCKDERDKEGIVVEEYLRLCEEEKKNRDITVEEYLMLCKQTELSQDVTVEEYLKLCKEERKSKYLTIEEYLELCKERLNEDITVEGMKVEEYLQLCEEEKKSRDLTVEEYLQLCEEEKRSRDMTVEEYLQLCQEEKKSRDLTVEEYLQLCQEEKKSRDMTVEEYLQLCEEEKKSRDMTVEEYLQLCEKEKRSRDMTVEEYLQLCEEEKKSRDMTVEEYLQLCEKEKRSRDMTVEEYLQLCEEEKKSRDMTVEEYLQLCEKEKRSRDMTVEEYLQLCEEEKMSRDMTVEEYLQLCEEEKKSRDLTVEEYLQLCQEEKKFRDMTVEEYLQLCEEEKKSRDMTVEEYLQLCEEEKKPRDLTVEEYLQLCQEEKKFRDMTVEEYLQLCEEEKKSRDMTVEEYLQLCQEEKKSRDTTVEEYLQLCEEERRTTDLSVEEYLLKFQLEDMEIFDAFKNNLYDDFKLDISKCHASEEVLNKEDDDGQYKEDCRVISTEGETIGYVGSLSLHKISFDQNPDDFGSFAMEKQPRSRLQIETEEDEITESVVAQAESSVDDWVIFDSVDMGDRGSAHDKGIVEEDLFHVSLSHSDENGMEELLQHHGLIYSAELWLIFPPYRRTPWINISVMYRDDVIFEWGILKVVEAEVSESGSIRESDAKIAFEEEETIDFSSNEIPACLAVEEDEVLASKVEVNFAEVEFSILDRFDDKFMNNNTVACADSYQNGHEKDIELQNVASNKSKKRVHPVLKSASRNSSDEQFNTAGNFPFVPLTHLTKKGLVYRSKERIFTGSDAESKSVWSNLEKLQCKHAKSVSLPESLRRTVSKNSLDIVEVSVEDEENEQVKQEIETEATRTLITSPLKIENFGKNLRESNV